MMILHLSFHLTIITISFPFSRCDTYPAYLMECMVDTSAPYRGQITMKIYLHCACRGASRGANEMPIICSLN